MKRKRSKSSVALVVIENNMVEINSHNIVSSKLPSGFNFKIAQISDFHNSAKQKEYAAKAIEKSAPDTIVITGDLIDSRKTKIDVSLDLIGQITKIAPCYYVTGNHEARIKEEYSAFKQELKQLGVTVLENESALLEISGAKINLIGLKDPRFSYDSDSKGKACKQIKESLAPLINSELYNLVLCHRPEAFEVYAELGADLVLTGHAHGGQIILFGLGAVSPNQGIFPRYIKGAYKRNGTTMIVSRGIGNSLFPFRFNNKPEVVEINLKGE